MRAYFRLKDKEFTQGYSAWYVVEVLRVVDVRPHPQASGCYVDVTERFATLRFDHDLPDAETTDGRGLQIELTLESLIPVSRQHASHGRMLTIMVGELEALVADQELEVIENLFESVGGLVEWHAPPIWLVGEKQKENA